MGCVFKPADINARQCLNTLFSNRIFSISFRLLIHFACLVPLSIILWKVLSDTAGANPIEYLTRKSGDWTLRLLLITLTVRPLAQLLKLPVLLSYRRAVGLQAFFYAVCHFITYLWLDQFFGWYEIVADIKERPFILAGFSAFVLLVPLAATSTRWAVARMGQAWKNLHRLVYAAISAGLLHYWWLVRADYEKAWVYLMILSLLFGYRIVRFLRFKLQPNPWA